MSQSTPKSTNEVHELRYRISQLENLVVQNSFNSTTNSSLPSNSSLLRTPHGLIDRVNELEGLLAASEHENEKLRKFAELLHVEKNRQEVQLLEKVFRSDTEKNDLQHEKELLQVQLAKGTQKLSNIQDYINGLPSQEELDEAKDLNFKLQQDNQLLEGKLMRMRDNVSSLQQDRMALENALREATAKLEDLKPLEEAEQAFSGEGELSALDVNDSQKVREFLTLQKAQLLRSSKIISTLRDKLFHLESDRADCLVKISNLESDLQSLQDQVESTQLRMESLMEKMKSLEQQKMDLISENGDLKHQIEKREINLEEREKHIYGLIQLVTEVDLSVKDVEKLVELGRSLALGEEPSMSTLLGFGQELENHIASLCKKDETKIDSGLDIVSNCSDYNPNDPEWTLDRLVKIRTIRKHLRELTDVARDLYTDMLGGKVEGCAVQ